MRPSSDPGDIAAYTKKLLRLGTDSPQCTGCGSTDEEALCLIAGPGKASHAILCHNCKAKRRQVNGKASQRKAHRFQEAGYFEPACVVCDEPTLQVLELDHLAGAANSDLTEPLCGNHHAAKSHLAEGGAMAALRLRDPERRALVLQAAFEFGLAAILGMFAVWDGSHDQMARSIFLGAASVGLFAWATWNLAADEYFVDILGPGYDRAIAAAVPR